MKRLLRIVAIALAIAVAVAGGYAAYVLIAWHRLPDEDLPADPGEAYAGEQPAPETGREYDIITWNLGFGAYSADYSFFMDGGTESRAFSKDAVLQNIDHAVDVLRTEDADFMLLQEVDIAATRSWQVNEAERIESALGGFVTFAQNYDSPYLFYPVTRPHGASKSGLLTLSDCRISRRERRSLPVESGFRKLLDLDRCYSVSHIPVGNGRELCLYNLHLSAYTADGAIATEQLGRMCEDMRAEYGKGNYIVAGGDFNKDLAGNSGEIFGVSGENYSWAQPLDAGMIPEGLRVVCPLDAAQPVPSCRNADTAYVPGKTFVLIVDGFIVSDNVTVADCHVIDEGFAASDHNPVKLTFTLNPEATEEA